MESMNNKDPFETFLKNQSFSEKASEPLRLKLENSATWNRPWWKNTTSIALLAAVLVVVAAVALLIIANQQQVVQPQAEQAGEQPMIEAPAPSRVIAKNGDNNMLSPLQRNLADLEPEFNLSFIDRPVNFVAARREYADLI